MTGRSARRLPSILATVSLALALSAGCKKNKEVLVIVSLTTPAPVTGLESLKLTIAGTAKTFALTQLSPTPSIYGIYVPDDVGDQVQVSAGVTTGSSCVGLAGSGAATITDDVGAASIALTEGNACSEPQPPSLGRCKEYDQIAPGTECDPYSDYPDLNPYVRSVAFSPDGRYFVSGTSDGRVKIWTFDGRTLRAEGTELPVLGVPQVAFSPDGKLLAVAAISDYDPQDIDLYEVGSWSKRRSLPTTAAFVPGIGFSADGRYVIALESDGYSGALLALPVNGGTPGLPELLTIDPWWLAVGPSQDGSGTSIAVASFSDQVVLLSFAGGRFTDPSVFSVTATGASAYARPIALSPDGRFLAAGGDDDAFRYWNVPFESATPVSQPFAVGQTLITMAFSPANDYVAVAAAAGYGTVTVWDLIAHSLRGSFRPTYAPYGIAYAPSGLAIAGGEDLCGKIFLCAD